MTRAAKKLRRDGGIAGGLDPARSRRLRAPGDARVLRALDEVRRDVRQVTEVERAVRVAARKLASVFDADDHCYAVVTPGIAEADLVAWTGPPESWDRAVLGAFARGQPIEFPPNAALARLRRRGRPWGTVGLRWNGGEVDWEIRNGLTRFARGLNDIIIDIDRERIAEVRARIDRKVMEQLRSRDLFYQILDGLRSLTRYDHSATLLIGDRDDPHLEIAADKMAWRKGKSRRVGLRFQIEQSLLDSLFAYGVSGYRRQDADLVCWDGSPAPSWVKALAAHTCSGSDEEPACSELLLAPLSTRDGLRAVLAVATVHPGTLGEYEADLLSSFLPQVSVALQNSRWAEALEARILETERKHAMADLARGVSHDVNNALGSIVPVLQQLREELAQGRVNIEMLRQDVDQIDRSVRVCRDIFGGMLRFARSSARPGGSAAMRPAVEMCLTILGDSLEKRGIEVHSDAPDDLPKVGLQQSELEQIVLNLVSNARDAMEGGGSLQIQSRREGDMLLLEVRDSGCGIPPEHLRRVQDPFFTTKPSGSGLGLSICRSLVWQCDGTLEIDSMVGHGTCVSIRLPVAEAAP